MTEEALKKVVKAIGVICVVIGGIGSILCVPYAVNASLALATTAGIYFIAGGVMITGGLITVALIQHPLK